jgi:hypothetical protein
MATGYRAVSKLGVAMIPSVAPDARPKILCRRVLGPNEVRVRTRAVMLLCWCFFVFGMEACCCPRADESNNLGCLGFFGFRYGGVLLPACGREQ